MSFFGVEINSQINRLLLQIKLYLRQHKFSPNFRTIYRAFAQQDPQIKGIVNQNQFQKALASNGIFFKKFEYQAFADAYRTNDNNIDWFTFMSHLRQPMSPIKRQLINDIFDQIDTQGKGQVSVETLILNFHPEQVQVVKQGRRTKQSIVNQLLNLISIPDNVVTKNEFIAYYDDLSVNFASNQAFIRHVSVQWKHKPRKIQIVTQQQIRFALKSLRFKLIQKTKGTTDEFFLRKLFTQYDQNKNGFINAYELDLLLKKIELPVQPKLIEPMLKKLDKNESGSIEYDQFKQFLFFDPYPS